MVYSNDGKNQPIYERQVHDADLRNWEHENPEFNHSTFPSRHNIGDMVKVFLMPHGEDTFPGFTGKIIAVHFTNSKVKYDVELIFAGDFTSRIYNIDSVLVQPIPKINLEENLDFDN